LAAANTAIQAFPAFLGFVDKPIDARIAN
jgi:hypothetical protein